MSDERWNMKGYKAFNQDMTCRGFQYKIGETYIHNGEIRLCVSGFHFCLDFNKCFDYYPLESRLCEVEALGHVTGYPDEKMVTDEIHIVREISEVEKCRMFYGNGIGYGNGYGRGYGNGHTYRDGTGRGDGVGYGRGLGNGYGGGYGNSNYCGCGDGDVAGYSNGYGDGYGDGERNNIYRILVLGGKE